MGSGVLLHCNALLSLSLLLLSGSTSPRPSHCTMDVEQWRGEQRKEGSGGIDPSRVTQLSWRPRIFLYEDFLSHAECDHLINLAKDKLEKSMVADIESGKGVLSHERTSSGMFLQENQDDTVTRIERRIASWTFLPEENGEAIQILRYEHGQQYKVHNDFSLTRPAWNLGASSCNCAYVPVKCPEREGKLSSLVLSILQGKYSQYKDDTWSECSRMGFAVKPRKGDAVLFFNLHPNATPDTYSLHGSCPVIEGEKWSATKWIHVRPFVEPEEDKSVDDEVHCP